MSSVLDFKTAPGDNSSINGIGIQGTAGIRNFDDALRTLLAFIARSQPRPQLKTDSYIGARDDFGQALVFAGGAHTLTLPPLASVAPGWHVLVEAPAGHPLIIARSGTNTINGAASFTLKPGFRAAVYATDSGDNYRLDLNLGAYPALPDTANIFSGLNTFTKTVKSAKGADIASATPLVIGNDGNAFDVTGTAPIAAVSSVGVGTTIKLHFNASLVLSHHATDLVLPGGANITTAAGDEMELFEYAAGKWRCTNYQLAGQAPILSAWEVIRNEPFTNISTYTLYNLAAFEKFRITMTAKAVSGAAGAGRLELSSDNGASWIMSNYVYNYIFQDSTPNYGGVSGTTASYIFVADITGLSTVCTLLYQGTLAAFNKPERTTYFSESWCRATNETLDKLARSGGNHGVAAIHNAFRIRFNQNVTGRILIEGLRG